MEVKYSHICRVMTLVCDDMALCRDTSRLIIDNAKRKIEAKK